MNHIKLLNNSKLMMEILLTQLYNCEKTALDELKDCHIEIVSIKLGTSDKFEFYCYTKYKTHRVINTPKGITHSITIN